MDGPASTSSVTVEYYDPSNVFQLLSPGLLSRLPLQNLHWKSSTRPLRSIASLHVDLVPSEENLHTLPLHLPSSSPQLTSATEKPLSSTPNEGEGLHRTHSEGQGQWQTVKTEGGHTQPKGFTRDRRHQIPGLRKTPYLKVFFLRCDDNETYKASSRKLLREWLTDHTSSSQTGAPSNTQENHDAFEWLIVHVVLPDTPAASQPGPGASASGASSGTEKSSSGSRWPGRGSSSILEKIRADFNGTSKSSKDRVAQIRIPKCDLPPHLLARSSPQPPSPYESAQDLEKAWADMMAKFRSLILTSFDLRVSQYEEDIREKDSQRGLPGWNFCTFFLLKEGLLRGFESVGLVEDALLGYDELSIGLDVMIREQAAQTDANHRSTFLPFTQDLRERLTSILDSPSRELQQQSEHTEVDGPENDAASLLDRKNYRDLILSSTVSVFDFRCYIFARQMELLLRLGTTFPSRSTLLSRVRTHPAASQSEYSFHEDPRHTSSSAGKDATEDLMTLADICHRAVDFITSASRLMKADLWEGYMNGIRLSTADVSSDPEREKSPVEGAVSEVIENLVLSWTFSASQHVLARTLTRTLSGRLEELNEAGLPADDSASVDTQAQSVSSRASITPSAKIDKSPWAEAASANAKASLEAITASRADLILLKRGVVEKLANKRHWPVGWDSVEVGENESSLTGMDNVNLDDIAEKGVDEQSDEKDKTELPEPSASGLSDSELKTAVASEIQLCELHGDLTEAALAHFRVANRSNSVEKLLADMAAFKFSLRDYESCAACLKNLSTSYAEKNWTSLEMAVLKMQAKCLLEVGQIEGYAKAVLKFLAKVIATRQIGSIGFGGQALQSQSDEMCGRNEAAGAAFLDGHGCMIELIKHTPSLTSPVAVPIDQFFEAISVDNYLQHFDDRDGFQVQLRLRYLLDDSLAAQKVKVRIVDNSLSQPREIWLQNDRDVTFVRGMNKLMVGANVSCPGYFTVDRIIVDAYNIHFVYERRKEPVMPTRLLRQSDSHTSAPKSKEARILCYAKSNALEANIFFSRSIHLSRSKSVDIEISSGWNQVVSGQIRIRSASAGLRLHTAEATVTNGSLILKDKPKAGVINFGELSRGTHTAIKIPYGLETDPIELSFKLEISYVTEKGEFLFISNPTIPIALPLGVNVQDIFKEESLFSRFTINAAGAVPLRVLGSELKSSPLYEVTSECSMLSPVLVFPKQSMSLIYRIAPRKIDPKVPGQEKASKMPLALDISYRCLDEDVFHAVEINFLAALRDSAFNKYSRLLLPRLLAHTKQMLTPQMLELIGLTGELELGGFDESGWNDIIQALHISDREGLDQWLKDWYKTNPTISLSTLDDPSIEQTSKLPIHAIAIPVEVPQIQVVHTAELSILSPDVPSSNGIDVTVSIGDVLPADIRIRHSRIWDVDRALAGKGGSAMGDRPLTFVYEVHANADHWLVGGQRQAHYSARENEAKVFNLVLIPLRAGHLLLPTIEIKHVKPHVPTAQGAAPGSLDAIPGGHAAVNPGGGVYNPSRASWIHNTSTASFQSSRRPSSSSTSSTYPHHGASLPGQAPAPGTGLGIDFPPSNPMLDARRRSSAASVQGDANALNVTCETDYKSLGQTVLVLPDMQTTTVSLDPARPGSGAWLMQGDRRLVAGTAGDA
ncbi:hypothetical protein L228DRAFT_262661 [Xylona heveae TC161]|uniref:TMEM1 family protein-like protein n=1 Tax=Xylona heveae (strain CBS 132557 / TC161) TaxID=1328760 RepID=A0A165FA27_XYLHT|nr:hypothetical protein L228DRAFT_262661 [Xylona heveae TC161]KZF20753.1 hypothetical protein L228DRAFT_262661 [Xylona heveae TC161]